MENILLSKLAGNYADNPRKVRLSERAQWLMYKAFEGIAPGDFWDYHVHIVGMGTGRTGNWVNPAMFSWTKPLDRTRMEVFISAAGIDDMQMFDQRYFSRLLELVLTFRHRGKFCLLALDKCYTEDGRVDEANTKLYVSNRHVYQLCQAYPDFFVPCISVHPYRPDALDELDKWGSRGVKMIKWLPDIMGMNASDARCIPFYEKMKQYGMVLLTHTGTESSIEVTKFKVLSNPLLFRRPLDMGVKIIMAHCAGLGVNLDIDQSVPKPAKNYSLFFRLMEERRYEGLLFGDISALTQVNRCGAPLRTVLERQEFHHRLINGSDYPLPAVNASVSTKLLARLGYILDEEIPALNEIYKMNPLLFDFVLKRALRHPQQRSIRFPAALFTRNPELGITGEFGKPAVPKALPAAAEAITN